MMEQRFKWLSTQRLDFRYFASHSGNWMNLEIQEFTVALNNADGENETQREQSFRVNCIKSDLSSIIFYN